MSSKQGELIMKINALRFQNPRMAIPTDINKYINRNQQNKNYIPVFGNNTLEVSLMGISDKFCKKNI